MQRFLLLAVILSICIGILIFSPQKAHADVASCKLQLVTNTTADASGQGNTGVFINVKASGIPNEVDAATVCATFGRKLSTQKIKIAIKRGARNGESIKNGCVDRDTLLGPGYSIGPLPSDGVYWVEADVVCPLGQTGSALLAGATDSCGNDTDPFTPLCGDTYQALLNTVAQTTPRPQAPSPPCASPLSKNSPNCPSIDTGLGITFPTDPVGAIQQLFRLLLGVAGGVALFLIIFSGYKIMTSQGNAETIQGARETITSAIVGLVFIIFSLVILQVIGVDIIKIPGWKP